jgi:hypothetical protein
MADEPVEFKIRVNDGEVQSFSSRFGVYSHAVMEAFGALKMPYPCDVEIWVEHLVPHGYGPYRYRIDDFFDGHGNHYACPSIMHAGAKEARDAE